MLDRANSKIPPEYPPRVEYVHADMFGYEPSAPYDLILCIGVLAHVDSIDGAVEKMARSVKPGGRVVVQISDGDQYLLRLQRSLQAVRNIAGSSRRPAFAAASVVACAVDVAACTSRRPSRH